MVVAEGDVAQFYLSCQFCHVGQVVARRQTQVWTLLSAVGHLLDALDRRTEPEKGLYAGYGSIDGIDGLVNKSLRGQQHAGCQFALQDQPRAQTYYNTVGQLQDNLWHGTDIYRGTDGGHTGIQGLCEGLFPLCEEIALVAKRLDGLQIAHACHRDVLQSCVGHFLFHGNFFLDSSCGTHHEYEQQDGEYLQQPKFPVEEHDKVATDDWQNGYTQDRQRVVHQFAGF